MVSFSHFPRTNGRIGAVGYLAFARLVCLLLCLPSLPVIAADEAALSSGQGYLLLLVNVSQRQRVSRFSFANADTEDEITIRAREFRPAGAGAWMVLVAAPAGRYYWSEYEAASGTAVEDSRNLEQTYRRGAPGSADDTFEIVAGAVNYIGDWTMRVTSSERRRIDPAIQYEKSTMERYITEYPELKNEHPIYLSMMGKEAISLVELAKIIESQSE